MKFDTTHMRYLTNDDFRVLTAVEMGSKNHEVVPTKLITSISGLKKHNQVQRSISDLAKVKLISKLKNNSYDGYRLTYLGYDYLALKAFVKRNNVSGVGTRIGIGKESDIFLAAAPDGTENVLKVHRLGRISFRSVKNNRDYLKKRQSASWMYLSRLSAEREFAFMKVLYDHGFQVPVPIDQSRHQVVMSLIDGIPLRKVTEHDNPARLYATLMDFIVKLANHGLIHCDFNEFNIMIKEQFENPEDEIVVIDFPQCVSISHPDAERYFKRDVDSIRLFFEKKLDYVAEDWPRFDRDVSREDKLDIYVEASGSNKKEVRELEKAMAEYRENLDNEAEDGSDYDSEDDDDDEEEEDEVDYTDDENDEEEEDEEDNEDNTKKGEPSSANSDLNSIY
ncbi:serine/threonine-protein kinase Rio2p [Trichomonascus vanleenenianus]|uniref:protein kinase RIO2 n=1 Tax=Trichomonascus vanleenenianus TaxID=2268995 RepID=UPI003EC9C627